MDRKVLRHFCIWKLEDLKCKEKLFKRCSPSFKGLFWYLLSPSCQHINLGGIEDLVKYDSNAILLKMLFKMMISSNELTRKVWLTKIWRNRISLKFAPHNLGIIVDAKTSTSSDSCVLIDCPQIFANSSNKSSTWFWVTWQNIRP